MPYRIFFLRSRKWRGEWAPMKKTNKYIFSDQDPAQTTNTFFRSRKWKGSGCPGKRQAQMSTDAHQWGRLGLTSQFSSGTSSLRSLLYVWKWSEGLSQVLWPTKKYVQISKLARLPSKDDIESNSWTLKHVSLHERYISDARHQSIGH